MRRFYARVPPTSPTDKISLISKNVAMTDHEKNINWLCKRLWDKERLDAFRLPLLMDEIDRQLGVSDDPLSPRIADYCGRLSIIGQYLRQLDQFYPWSTSFTNGPGLQAQPAIAKTCEAWYACIDNQLAGLGERATELVRLVDDYKAAFHYPSHRQPSRANVEVLRRAEHNLDQFWDAVDAARRRGDGELASAAVVLRIRR
ncbi:hypothetical protein CspHIS471_0308490 [Cutaneotrichosporon sp. HIS471]|nr:hypothetical protein CspHIS471_0308490 [Cutaneotrichosporon sp. HIS471]